MGFAVPDAVINFFDHLIAWSEPTRKVMRGSWRHCNRAQTVIHGDARIGNMMFPSSPSRPFVLFDWQAVRHGVAAFDLAYFLVLSLNAEQRQHREQDALKTYAVALEAAGGTLAATDLASDYNHACLAVLTLLALPGLAARQAWKARPPEFLFGECKSGSGDSKPSSPSSITTGWRGNIN